MRKFIFVLYFYDTSGSGANGVEEITIEAKDELQATREANRLCTAREKYYPQRVYTIESYSEVSND